MWRSWLLLAPCLAAKCADLGCGTRGDSCSCVPSCWSFDDCCEDFLQVCPEQTPTLRLGDLNFLVTTDLHSWLEGRVHQPHLNATLAHVAAMHDELRARAKAQEKELFFFDNGDINDGTGLSALAPDHVAYLTPVMRTARYDALNLGNHELYQRNDLGRLPGVACPVVALKQDGYIDSWQGRYVTSNVVWAENDEPVGARYAVLTGDFGSKLLVFGFLYNMEDHCDAVKVNPVEQVVNSSWFLKALEGAYDAVVVLAHMDYRDPLVDVIHRSIRQRHATMPIQVLAGHSHIRGYRQLDNFSTVFEAGCKLDTVGFLSLTRLADGGLRFERANVTGHVRAMATALQLPTLAPELEMQRALQSARSTARTDEVLGCAQQHFHLSSALDQKDSLWGFYMREVLPKILLEPKQLAIVGTGALSYDVYAGPFTVNDAYATSPYGNAWLIFRSIPGPVLRLLLERLNTSREARRLAPYDGIPRYATSEEPGAGTYDLVVCDFDREIVQRYLTPLMKREVHSEVFQPAMNTSSVLEAWFKQEPCAGVLV